MRLVIERPLLSRGDKRVPTLPNVTNGRWTSQEVDTFGKPNPLISDSFLIRNESPP